MTSIRASSLLIFLWLLPLAAGDRDVRRIQDKLTAPCCWQESVAVHRSEIAEEMRAEIARMASGGMSEDQIVDYYIARHGERILREPRGSKRLWLMLIPVALITVAFAGLIVFLRRQRQAPSPAVDIAGLPPLPDLDLE